MALKITSKGKLCTEVQILNEDGVDLAKYFRSATIRLSVGELITVTFEGSADEVEIDEALLIEASKTQEIFEKVLEGQKRDYARERAEEYKKQERLIRLLKPEITEIELEEILHEINA